MLTRLFLLLCLTECVFPDETPVVDCLVVHLKYVHCTWTNTSPAVNYTFYTRSSNDKRFTECTAYLSKDGINTGCDYHYGEKKLFHFEPFYTKLVHGNHSYEKVHHLKTKVKLNPPVNMTVQNGTDGNLWFYWNQTSSGCVQSEVQYRANNLDWRRSSVSEGKQFYCIILPSSSSSYELQVRSKMSSTCGGSEFWSDWSDPVVWGSNNSTDSNHIKESMTVWTPVLYVMGILILILLVMMLLHHERLRIILIPVVPKPSLVPRDIEDWAQVSKGLKENFKANYNERACPVREYCHVAQSDSESSDSSTFSVTTDQTDCSVSIPVESELSTSCSLSTSTVPVSPEEEREQVSV